MSGVHYSIKSNSIIKFNQYSVKLIYESLDLNPDVVSYSIINNSIKINKINKEIESIPLDRKIASCNEMKKRFSYQAKDYSKLEKFLQEHRPERAELCVFDIGIHCWAIKDHQLNLILYNYDEIKLIAAGDLPNHLSCPDCLLPLIAGNKSIKQLPFKEVDGIRFFEDEVKNKQEICFNFNKAKNGNFLERIYARKCNVVELSRSQGKSLINRWHLQNATNLGIIYFGLSYNNEIVGLLSLGRHSRDNMSNIIVLDRLCFKSNTQIIGGASKLFNKAIEWSKLNGYDAILTFSDNRLTDGDLYQKLGFELDRIHRPDYYYFDLMGKRFSKQSQKKSKHLPQDWTESQRSEYKLLTKVYDFGKKRWIYKINENYETRKESLSRRASERHSIGDFNGCHIKGNFYSKKQNKHISFASSYELRCLYLLENDENIESFDRCFYFKINNNWRCPDFLVAYKDETKTIFEIKPEIRLKEQDVINQIADTKTYCQNHSFNFKLWTEKDSGLTEKKITKWAIDYLNCNSQYQIDKRSSGRRRQAIYYNKIKTNKIKIFCDYCQIEHEIMLLSYRKNIKNNGRYICHLENAHKSKPKKSNNLSDQKKCCLCKEIKLFNEFQKDKSRSDGYASRCKKCRSKSLNKI